MEEIRGIARPMSAMKMPIKFARGSNHEALFVVDPAVGPLRWDCNTMRSGELTRLQSIAVRVPCCLPDSLGTMQLRAATACRFVFLC